VSSVHLTVNRESLIDMTIETAVSRMQTVVELGRVIRDRRTLPMKVCKLFYAVNPFNASCSNLLPFKGFSTILI